MTPTAPAIVDAAPGLEHCFLFEATEASYPVTSIEGEIPRFLRGSYYVNGPARFERAGRRYKHWLDGDGMICSLRFGESGVQFTSRFVETPKLAAERDAGRFLYRGFGTSFEDDRLRRGLMLEPPVNVSAYRFDGRLLAFSEQSLPYDLDPVTLETRGVYDFHGKLNEVSPFSAHAKFDTNLMNFGVQFSRDNPTLNVYEFTPGGELVRRKRHPLRHPYSVHDFAFTPSSYVFFLGPLLMDFGRFVEGVSVMESLSWEPEKGSEIVVVPRHDKSREVFSVPAGQGYALHGINAFEDDDRLTVDILELDEPVYAQYEPIPDLFATVKGCRPARFVIDKRTRELTARMTLPYEHTPDFPSIHPSLAGRAYSHFWMLGISAAGRPGRKFFDELAHGDWSAGAVDVYRAAPGVYLGGEPVFIPNPDSARDDEGAVIVEEITPESNSAILIFDAARVANGPVARLRLQHRVHPGFHSSFHPETIA
ncbi:MAG: carotenoid oxygenase family protein [Bryobacteraceae bacterium]